MAAPEGLMLFGFAGRKTPLAASLMSIPNFLRICLASKARRSVPATIGWAADSGGRKLPAFSRLH